MAFGSITVRPGVNSVRTQTLNQAGISDSNLIRFRDGLVEKLGGWTRYVADAMGSVTKALLGWMDLTGNKRLAVGSLASLKVISGSSVNNITPQELITNPTPNFSTTIGSPIVTIVDASINNLTLFDAVFFNTPIAVGGIVLYGLYQINDGGLGTSYTITAHSFATSTVANGGAVPTLTTTAGSTEVVVTIVDHGLQVGERFYLPISTVVGGISVSGAFSVISVVTANTFTIVVPNPAITTATVSMNGGNAQLLYYLGPPSSLSRRIGGFILDTVPLGYLALGEGTMVTVSLGATTGTDIVVEDWHLVNWGKLLIANPRGLPIFVWDPETQLGSAYPLGVGPAFSNGIFLATPQQILVAWGTSNSLTSAGVYLDPLMIRWSDILDFTVWIPTATNQAGSFRIPTGSEIRGAIQAANQAIILTDIDVYTMQYVGLPFVFSFQKIGDGCGLIGSHALCSMGGNVYYMGDKQFYFIGSGGIRSIPCPVWDTVFQDLDQTNKHKCVAAANSMFNEVTFYYPSASGIDGVTTGECDKYVKFNTDQMVWDVGVLARSAWTDQSIIGNPVGADPGTTYLQQHEIGYNDDTAAIVSRFETGYFAYAEGEEFPFIDMIVPDMKWATLNSTASAVLSLDIESQKWPNDVGFMDSQLTMTSTTEYMMARVRGRQIKFTAQSSDIDSWWRMGDVRFRIAVDGRN
jgi:hypothetical protein